MKAMILAGGSGTRLWPLSRKSHPKQFLRFYGEKFLLQNTVDRISGATSIENMIVMTNDEYKYYVKSDLGGLDHLILEPVGRNTAPAIALGMKYCMEKLQCDGDEVLFVSPADHIIDPADKFADWIRAAEAAAGENKIVTFGVPPTRAETGYGYLRIGDRQGSSGDREFFSVEAFTEKPDPETAQQYLSEGNYLWNSGMFAFKISTMIEELHRYAPSIGAMFEKSYDEMVRDYETMPDISIDYAVMEQSNRVVAIPLDLYWNDIGSWDSLFEVLKKDENGNAFQGDVVTVETKGTMILGNKRLIAAVGLEDSLVVETDDAILVAKKGETQKVKEILNKLNGRKEATEHVTIYRPWGKYTVLEEGSTYKVKRIVISPKERLSLQMHYHRSEHWVVIAGKARVKIGDRETFVYVNESIYVPKSTLHRLENPGKVPLEIIEVQNGEYLEEDDIVRFEDSYGRN